MKCFLSSFKLEEDESIMRVPILKDRVRSQCSNKNQRILERAREKCADSKAWFHLNVADHAVLWATVQLHAAHSPVQCFHIYIYICIYIYTSSTFTQSTSGLRLFGSFIKNQIPKCGWFQFDDLEEIPRQKVKNSQNWTLNIFYLPSNHGLLEEDNSKPASHNTLEKSNLRNNTLHLWPKVLAHWALTAAAYLGIEAGQCWCQITQVMAGCQVDYTCFGLFWIIR